MALLELSLAVARVMFVYDFRLVEGELGHVGQGAQGSGKLSEFQLFTTVTSFCKGPWLVFRKREREWL